MLSPLVILFLAGSGTALATGLGAIPVWLLGTHATTLRPALWGAAAGVMVVASVAGLVIPAFDEGGRESLALGLLVGVVFLLLVRTLLGRSEDHVSALRRPAVRTSILVFAVLLVHSLPEGFAIGTAYASQTAGLGLFVIVAIALQNVPEGTGVAIPMEEAGFSRSQQFWAAVLTSAPQPVGAMGSYLLVKQIEALLPISFGFAAGAMLCLVAIELLPIAVRAGLASACWGLALGSGVMVFLSVLLGVD